MSNTINKAVTHKVFSLKKDVKIKRLATIWTTSIAALIIIGSQIVTFNTPFFGMRPNTIDIRWFNTVFTIMAAGFPIAAGLFFGFHTIKKDSEISDNTYNVLRLTGFTIIASTGLVFVLAPVAFGTFLPYILGDFSTMGSGMLPTSYAMIFPVLFIMLVMPAPIIGLSMTIIKKDWIKVSNDTYIRTRNWFLASSSISFFLLPLTVTGEGIWMIDATGLNPTNWQSNSFFVIHVGGQVTLFIMFAISMLNKKYYKKLGSYKKFSRIKNQYLVIMGGLIVSGATIWFFDSFVAQKLFSSTGTGVKSLGTLIPGDTVFAILDGETMKPILDNIGVIILPSGIELDLSNPVINAIIINLIDSNGGVKLDASSLNLILSELKGNGIYVGGGMFGAHGYFIGAFWISILSAAILIGMPTIDYLFYKGKAVRSKQI